jgi:hypothetical protein
MRPLGGQTRMMSPRQAIVAAVVAAKTASVKTHAPMSPACEGGTGVEAASRSIAVMDGKVGDNSGNAGSLGTAASGAGRCCSASRTAIHSPPHRTQRTTFCGGSREAGTSYAAAQLGQAIRIEAYRAMGWYSKDWIIWTKHLLVQNVFRRMRAIKNLAEGWVG